jgi:hypothetical protein
VIDRERIDSATYRVLLEESRFLECELPIVFVDIEHAALRSERETSVTQRPTHETLNEIQKRSGSTTCDRSKSQQITRHEPSAL